MKILFSLLSLFFFYPLFSQNLTSDLKYHPDFNASLYPFFHGVASGDADQNSLVIWTRITPDASLDSIFVNWRIATDSLFRFISDSGSLKTYPSRDYTVKILVKNLKPDTHYFYRFMALGRKSPIGYTRTLPPENKLIKKIRLVFFTGSNYNAGYFNAYSSICNRHDIDAVVHLGDYFYEYGNNKYGHNKNRSLKPLHECISLQDYLNRFSHYRLDAALREAHRKYCWYLIWDDHETADNSWKNGAKNHQKNEGNWQKRKKAAVKAYFEWLPIRNNRDSSIFRIFKFGKLARFILLDTRLQARDYQKIPPNDTNKTMLGKKQLHWLFKQLLLARNDSVSWIFITQQVMFAPLMIGKKVINYDQWDGYQYERKKIIHFILKNNMNNVVIISGDVHTSWANEIFSDKKLRRKAFTIPEFITPSITSPSMSKFQGKIANFLIPLIFWHVRYVDMYRKGYMILNITKDTVDAEWYYLKTIKTKNNKIIRKRMYEITKKTEKRINKKRFVK
jgi:alkaline phosphatase D